MSWEGLTPPYSTIVVDPPWHYDKVNPDNTFTGYRGGGLAYSSLTLPDIEALPVGDLTTDGRCFLWTTNRYLPDSWSVLRAWGFTPQERVLVWCKTPEGTTPVTTEFILIGRKGKPPRMPWHGTTWFPWPKQRGHSAKPAAFFDLVESWCPGPYVELFSRTPRLGWDSWGYGYEGVA
jgi:N6-adenosine-specific RNA methylase IME4